MKVSFDKDAKDFKTNSDAILPLKHEKVEMEKHEYVPMKLKMNAAAADSPTYYYNVRYIDCDSTVREAIQFIKDMNVVWTHTGVNTVPDKINVCNQVLKGQALSAFSQGIEVSVQKHWTDLKTAAHRASRAAGETVAEQQAAVAAIAKPAVRIEDQTAGFNSLMKLICPAKALQKVRRYLRRFCRKPADMSVRQYFTALRHINDEELPWLPPFSPGQSLTDDELAEIIYYGVPNSWKQEMTRQGFDPMENTLGAVLLFCERLEECEDFKPDAKKAEASKGSVSKKHSKSYSKGNGGEKNCMLHGKGSHSTEECKTLQGLAKKRKADFSPGKENDKKPKYKNKTWTKKDSSGKEIAAMVKKQVKKELHVADKKRKASKADSDSDVEAFLIENGGDDIDLSKFNYEDMDKMKIDDIDEVSV